MRNQKKIGKILFNITSVVFLFLFFFTFVYADFLYQPLSPLPGTTNTSDGKVTDLGTYITGLYKIVIGISIVLAVVLFMVAGLEWMTAEAVGKKEDAIKRINAVLFGLLLTIGSWLFLNTINPNILKVDLKIDEVTIDDSDLLLGYGFFCKVNNSYYGPYSTEAECQEKTECKGAYNNRYCIRRGSSTSGTGEIGSHLDDPVVITDFFDTGIQMDDEFLKSSGPGFYYRYFGSSFVLSGLFQTADACENERAKKQKEGANGITDTCFLVEWGNSDFVLNKMLIDEASGETALREILKNAGVLINYTGYVKYNGKPVETGCTSVGQTDCTNVGGLHLSTISNLTTMKGDCDKWIDEQGRIEKKDLGECNIKLTAGTEWWLHGAKEKDISDAATGLKGPSTYHIPTYFDEGKTNIFGKDIDLLSKDSNGGNTKTGFNYFIIKHTQKICSGGKNITKEKTMDPEKKKENLTYLTDLGFGQEFMPDDMTKFCTNSPNAMFRYERDPTHWHVRFGSCDCN